MKWIVRPRGRDRVSPSWGRDQVGPSMDRASSSMDRAGPSLDQVGPSMDRASPSMDRVSPSRRMNQVGSSNGEGIKLLLQAQLDMLSCFFVCHKENGQYRTYLNPVCPKGVEQVNHDHVHKYPNDNGEVEGQKWDVVCEKPDRAVKRVNHGWGRHHDTSKDIRNCHHKSCEAPKYINNQERKHCFDAVILPFSNNAWCLHGAPFGKGSWLQKMQENKKQSDTQSYDNHEALEDELESLLVLKLVELGRLEKWNLFIHCFEYHERKMATLNMRTILVMLREMKEHWTRVKIHIWTNFTTVVIGLSGGPKACERMKEPHWKYIWHQNQMRRWRTDFNPIALSPKDKNKLQKRKCKITLWPAF